MVDTPGNFIHLAITDAQFEQVRSLRRAFLAWQKATYSDHLDLIDQYFDPEKFERELQLLPGPYGPPTGALLLAAVDGIPAGTVGLRRFDDKICEMKAMFVDVRFHGRGLGRALAEQIIAEARQLGYRKMRLDTGPRQLAAQGLYRSLGFREIEAYYDLPEAIRIGAVFMELALQE